MKAYIKELEITGPCDGSSLRPNIDYTAITIDSKGRELMKITFKAKIPFGCESVQWFRDKFYSRSL